MQSKDWFLLIQIGLSPFMAAYSFLYFQAMKEQWEKEEYMTLIMLITLSPLMFGLWVFIWFGLPRFFSVQP